MKISHNAFGEMFTQLQQAVQQTVVPVGCYFTEISDYLPTGTGTLLAVGESNFIVTAGHVVEPWEQRNGGVCMFIPSGKGEHGTTVNVAPLTGQPHRVEDPADIAIIQLSEETSASLSACRFLRLSEMALSPETNGMGWVYGFPNEFIREVEPRAKRIEAFTMGTPILAHDGSGLSNFDPLYHFALDANPKSFEWSDGSGPATFPNRFQGISGGAVWQTWWPSRGGVDELRSRGLKIVGVQTSVYTGKSLIKATKWGCVVELIRQLYPKLRPILGMHFGPDFAR